MAAVVEAVMLVVLVVAGIAFCISCRVSQWIVYGCSVPACEPTSTVSVKAAASAPNPSHFGILHIANVLYDL